MWAACDTQVRKCAEPWKCGAGLRLPGHEAGEVHAGGVKGGGFVVARLPSDDDSVVCWSAPSWFHIRVSASGFTTGVCNR